MKKRKLTGGADDPRDRADTSGAAGDPHPQSGDIPSVGVPSGNGAGKPGGEDYAGKAERSRAKKERRRSRLQTVSLVLSLVCFLLGLFLLLYPAAADYLNSVMNGETIVAYQHQVMTMSDEDNDAILEEAQAYNQDLFLRTPFIGDLTSARKEEYERLLDVDGNGVMGYLEIEKIHVYLAIYHGTENETLQNAVGHVSGSSLPVSGESVHTVLAGHSGLPSAKLFTDVDQLELGDRFSVHVLDETYVYEVESISRILPDDLKEVRIEEGRELCTLMTCSPYGVNTHRLLVTGHRIDLPTDAPSEGTDELPPAAVPRWDMGRLLVPAVIFLAASFAGISTVLLIGRKRRRSRSGRTDR